MLISNDAVLFGILTSMVGFVFYTSGLKHPFWKRLYTFVPPVLMCYLLPATLNWPLGWIDPEASGLYKPMASRYLLPASLVLLCLSIDIKGLINLGPKALIMFFTATVSIVVGGPIALFLITSMAPDLIGLTSDELWRGLTTIAGSWIGGGANQTAMREMNDVGADVFQSMVVVDIIVGNIWMAFLLYGAGMSKRIDRWFKADTTAIDELKEKVEHYQASIARVTTTKDLFIIGAIAFGATAIGHIVADIVGPMFAEYNETSGGVLDDWGLSNLASGFFWLVVVATTLGFALSFTPLRKYEGAGASKIGSVFIYLLVATIGMQMNLGEITENLGIFAIGIVWMLIHISILLGMGRLIRAPFFFTAVGSQANVGGAASAPIVAAEFSPALAPVGALMAVLGYALGTYGAIVCGWLLEFASK